MAGEVAALLGFASLFGLMLLRVPIGISMILVGFAGFAMVIGLKPSLSQLSSVPIRVATDEVFGVVPLFILMGTLAAMSGMGSELYKASHAWVGHLKGGLAMATILACGGFAAICGSSVASAATLGKIALPEMQKFGYKQTIATGTIAAGGTLGILIPPSVVLAIYGIITEQDIALLFIAGLIPGLLAVLLYLVLILGMARLDPDTAPGVGKFRWREAFLSLRGVWAVMVLFCFVIGGIYFGIFTPTEAAAMGAGGTLILTWLRGTMNFRRMMQALIESTRMTGAIFVIAIGAVLFGRFLTVTRTPQELASFVGTLDWSSSAILLLVIVGYLLLGMILDSLAIILLTVPIIFPVMTQLGYDPIWFGILLVMVIEIGLITPPYGKNVFVLKSVSPEVSLGTIYRGVMPFVLTDFVRVLLIVLFPFLVLWLPYSMY